MTNSNPTFTITYKLIGKIEEVSYETKRFKNEDELEDELRKEGEYGQVSYYRFSQKGREPQLLAFI